MVDSCWPQKIVISITIIDDDGGDDDDCFVKWLTDKRH